MKAWIFAATSILLTASPVRADHIDALIKAEMQRQQIPGLSVAVVRNGKIVKEQAYGLANIEHQVAATPATIFQSGSVGKQFTAALTMLLVQDGKLQLDAPISDYLPEAPLAWEKISLRHLLTHTSGLDRFDSSIDLRKDYTEEQLLESAAKQPLLFAPGEQWAYSNMGYQILGIVCSKVGGKFYGDQLAERIFKPSGMRTRIIDERDIVPHRAAGYQAVLRGWLNQEWVSPSLNTTADGSLYLTAHDLALWSIALDGDKLLSKAIKQASWTPATLKDGRATSYGFGWQIGAVNGHRRAQHGGVWQGFSAQIVRYIDDGLALIVLANVSGARLSALADKLMPHYLPALAPRGVTGPIFLRGTMNEWDASTPMIRQGQHAFSVQLQLAQGKHSFKIGSQDWTKVDLGAPAGQGELQLGAVTQMDEQGENLELDLPQAGLYQFRLDTSKPSSPRLTVTPKQAK